MYTSQESIRVEPLVVIKQKRHARGSTRVETAIAEI